MNQMQKVSKSLHSIKFLAPRHYSNSSVKTNCYALIQKVFQTALPLAKVSTSEAASVKLKKLKTGFFGQAWKKTLHHLTSCNTTLRDKTYLLVQAVLVGKWDTAV